MPDHFHAIVGINDPLPTRMLEHEPPDQDGRRQGSAPTGKPWGIPDLVRRFKTYTIRLYAAGVTEQHWPLYREHLWQRSYWDRIIRNDRELEAHREYIFNNALRDYFKRHA